MKVAIFGSEGFLGSELYNVLKEYFDIQGITRSNYTSKKGENFDIFINANGNSRRYWANNNIIEDFDASTISVYKTILDFKTKLYIYISSADVYLMHDSILKTKENDVIDYSKLSPYGFHKYLSELIVKRYSKSFLILRCSALIGKNMKKGPIKDLIDGKPLFITIDSKLQFITTNEVAKIIMELVQKNIKNEIYNVGGIETVLIRHLEKIINKKIEMHRNAEKQVYELDISKLRKVFQLKTSVEYLKDVFGIMKGDFK